MNKANSGGALFDACGNVMGINMMVKDGAQFAYVVDPLLEGLKAAGVDAKVASEHCGSAAAAAPAQRRARKDAEASKNAQWWGPKGAEWIPVVLLAAAIADGVSAGAEESLASDGAAAAFAGAGDVCAANCVRERGRSRRCAASTGQYAGKIVSARCGS